MDHLYYLTLVVGALLFWGFVVWFLFVRKPAKIQKK